MCGVPCEYGALGRDPFGLGRSSRRQRGALRIGSPNNHELVADLTKCSGRGVILPSENRDPDECPEHSTGCLWRSASWPHSPSRPMPVRPALQDKQAFALEDDFVSWTMSAAPGSECIQGLRWSYMQIYSVLVLKAPTKGKLVIVGSGFRYVADSGTAMPTASRWWCLERTGSNPANPYWTLR